MVYIPFQILLKPFFIGLGEKQGMLLNNECNSWYDRAGIFQYQFVIGENSYCMSMDQCAWPNRTTPLQSVWSMPLSAMKVECDHFTCSYYVLIHVPCHTNYTTNTNNNKPT